MNRECPVTRAAGVRLFKPCRVRLATVLGCALVAGSAPSLAAVGVDSTELRDAVTVDGIRAHQQALQSIADDADDNRASGAAGYDASADYVEEQLTAAGYPVAVQPFSFPFFQELSDAVLERTSPNPTAYVLVTDFLTMEYSGAGVVTALIQPTNDVVIPPGAAANTSTSGCEAEDFDGFVAGSIALIQRGACAFGVKAQNAEAAGAAGVIIFNEGQEGARR